METSTRLIPRDLNSPIAFLIRPIRNFGLPSGAVDVRTFLLHVFKVAEALKEAKYAINLCGNRYLFMVSFCAAIVRGQTNLLPPNKNKITQRDLAKAYQDCYIIHDGAELEPTLANVDLSVLKVDDYATHISAASIASPYVSSDHLACISFTSGSTGRSKPNLKYWRTLYESSVINYPYMIPNTEETVFQLATMPAQHMWGLETSVLLPLFRNVCMSDAQPLFPQDIMDALQALPSPKMLVSTPLHLKALTNDQTNSLSLHSVLCATSPLTKEVASDIERLFSCLLREIYGCSEVGSMAVRRPAKEPLWFRFEGIHFNKEGDEIIASALHLPEPIKLQDEIELVSGNHFNLCGRASDLINIAGKRGSLFEINQVLLGFDGLKDGVVIQPESNASIVRLIAIVVLKNGVTKMDLTAFLREQLDSVFVPRPIYSVDALPRDDNGKLLKANLTTLLESLRS